MMNAFSKKILFLLVLSNCSIQPALVTYEFSGGRFGDNLLAYLRALWISHVYKDQVPVLYKPFKYSDRLVLHTLDQQVVNKIVSLKNVEKIVFTKEKMTLDPKRRALYVIPYFAEAEAERKLPWNRSWIYFAVDWDDAAFYKKMVQRIRPLNEQLLNVNLPADCITVALHVRKGEGFDGALLSEATAKKEGVDYADKNVPLKFPPDYFYTDQLKKISEIFNGAKIYAFIFTDAAQPAAVAARFKAALDGYSNIELDYRRTHNSHDANVVEDFFAMTQFDCLIRPESNFSIVAAKIANYKVEIYPTAHHWNGIKSIIDKVEIKMARKFH